MNAAEACKAGLQMQWARTWRVEIRRIHGRVQHCVSATKASMASLQKQWPREWTLDRRVLKRASESVGHCIVLADSLPPTLRNSPLFHSLLLTV